MVRLDVGLVQSSDVFVTYTEFSALADWLSMSIGERCGILAMSQADLLHLDFSPVLIMAISERSARRMAYAVTLMRRMHANQQGQATIVRPPPPPASYMGKH
jgi:hypothetical protein